MNSRDSSTRVLIISFYDEGCEIEKEVKILLEKKHDVATAYFLVSQLNYLEKPIEV